MEGKEKEEEVEKSNFQKHRVNSCLKMMVKDNKFEIEDSDHSDPDEDKKTDFTNYSRNRGKLCSKKS